jgi:hypothetical protein
VYFGAEERLHSRIVDPDRFNPDKDTDPDPHRDPDPSPR